MNCGEVRDLIQLYLDDELDTRSTLSVQQHLEGCPSCAGAFETFLQQDQLLQRAARAETIDSSRVRANILAALQPPPSMSAPSTAAPASTGLWQKTLQALQYGWRMPTWPRFAVTVALVLVMVVAALRFDWMPGVNEAVYAAAAADHAAHCAANMMMEGDITDTAELNRLAAAFAHVRAVPDLAAFGYGSPRGRLCKVNETEFMHIVYQHALDIESVLHVVFTLTYYLFL